MGEILRARLAKRAKSIKPKYYFSGYTDFDTTTVITKQLNPIVISDATHFLMLGFCVTYKYTADELINTQDNADLLLDLSAGRSSFRYQYAPRQFMLENSSINSATDWEHYVFLEPAEQINLAVTNNFINGDADVMSVSFTAYGEEYRF